MEPDHKMMQIGGAFMSVAPTATPFRPKRIFGNFVNYFWEKSVFEEIVFFVLIKPQPTLPK